MTQNDTVKASDRKNIVHFSTIGGSLNVNLHLQQLFIDGTNELGRF